jgi:hypothetical protein
MCTKLVITVLRGTESGRRYRRHRETLKDYCVTFTAPCLLYVRRHLIIKNAAFFKMGLSLALMYATIRTALKDMPSWLKILIIYCEVDIEFVYIPYANFRFQACSVALAVSCRLFMVYVPDPFCESSCEICGRQSETGRSFSMSTSVFPCQYLSTIAPYPSLC